MLILAGYRAIQWYTEPQIEEDVAQWRASRVWPRVSGKYGLAPFNLDTGWVDWYQDYPHPNDFFQPLLAGESILPTNNNNFAYINDPKLNAKIARLRTEQLGPKQEAEYAELDKEYMEQAPWAPYGQRTLTTFVSSEIDLDKIIFNPTFGQDLTSFQFK